MILRQRPGLREVVFALRGSILPKIYRRILTMAVLAVGVVALAQAYPATFGSLSATPFTLVGISLSIFLSFRNNACYDRWWEARKHWGQLIVDVRGLARETAGLGEIDWQRATFLKGLCGYVHALAARLRDEDEVAAALSWTTDASRFAEHPNPSDAMLNLLGNDIAALANAGMITEWRYSILEARLVSLSGVQAACERIKSTPPPFAYSLLVHRTAYLFCLLLPFGLAGGMGWATPIPVAIVAYAFFGLDALGDELEDPFGSDDNDLPLDALVRTAERDIIAAFDANPVPPALKPDRYRLG
jgi:putative membrane protein